MISGAKILEVVEDEFIHEDEFYHVDNETNIYDCVYNMVCHNSLISDQGKKKIQRLIK